MYSPTKPTSTNITPNRKERMPTVDAQPSTVSPTTTLWYTARARYAIEAALPPLVMPAATPAPR